MATIIRIRQDEPDFPGNLNFFFSYFLVNVKIYQGIYVMDG